MQERKAQGQIRNPKGKQNCEGGGRGGAGSGCERAEGPAGGKPEKGAGKSRGACIGTKRGGREVRG